MPIIKAPSSDSEMESLYSEDEEIVEAPKTSDAEEASEVEGYTELVSKKLLLGKDAKAGDKVILTVVKDYGDEVELKYATESADPEETEMSEDEELDMLSA